MEINYLEKYSKYKNKYLELKQVLEGGVMPKKIEIVLTINDPYTKDVNTGDVDDWFAILFLAQKYGRNTHIIIIDYEARIKQPQTKYMIENITNLYGCSFYNGDNLFTNEVPINNNSQVKLSSIPYDVCFICAPLSEQTYKFFKETIKERAQNPYYFLQGGVGPATSPGYNNAGSFVDTSGNIHEILPNGKAKFKQGACVFDLCPHIKPNVRELLSVQTNQVYPINKLGRYYNQIPFFINWNTYQLKKCLSIFMNGLKFGMFFGPETSNPWKGSGNSKKTLDIVIEAIGRDKFDAISVASLNPTLKAGYDKYLNWLVEVKGPGPENKDLREKQLALIYPIYIDIMRLATLLFGENVGILINEDGSIKDIGQMPNFVPRDGVLKYTPQLFDFNVVAFIYNMDNPFKSNKLRSNWSDQMQINQYISWQVKREYINTTLLAKMLEQIFNDFKLIDESRLKEQVSLFLK